MTVKLPVSLSRQARADPFRYDDMRVCFNIPRAYPLFDATSSSVFGGAELHGSVLAKGLAARDGFDVSVIVAEEGQPTRQRLALKSESCAITGTSSQTDQAVTSGGAAVDVIAHNLPTHFSERLNARCALKFAWGGPLGIKVLRWSPHLLWDLPLLALDGLTAGRWLGRPRFVEAIRELKADAVCTFGVYPPSHHVAYTCHKLGIPCYFFLMDDLIFNTSASGHKRYRAQLSLASGVVPQTQSQRKLLCDHYGIEGSLIRNPLAESVSANSATQLTPMAERKHVLWIGRADTHGKRPALCYELAKRSPHIPFVMIMNPIVGKQDLYEAIRAEAPENVNLIDRVPFEHVSTYFDQAVAFISTSASEGFPNTFLQAAQHATPVLSLDVNPDDVLTDQGIGVFAQGSMDRLAQALTQMWNDRAAAAAIGTAGQQYVTTHHGVDVCVNQLIELLKK